MRWLVFVALACACGGSSPDEQLLKAVQPAEGWGPALRMVAEKYSHNSVPASFVRNSADAADDAVEKAMQAVDKSDASPRLRDRLRRELTDVRNMAASLRGRVR